MLTVIVSVRNSAMGSVRALHAIARDVRLELVFRDLERLIGLRGLANLDGVILARGMSFPILGHQQAAQVAMSREDDAEHVPDLALRSEEHTSELQSRGHLVCRLLLE